MGFCQGPKPLMTKKSWRKTRDFFPSLFPVFLTSLPLCCPWSSRTQIPGTSQAQQDSGDTEVKSPCPTPCLGWQYHLSIIPLRKAQKAGILLPRQFVHLLQAISLPAARDGDDFLWPPSKKGSANSWHQGCFLIQIGPSWQITAPLCDSVSPSVHRGSDALSDSSEGLMLRNAVSDMPELAQSYRLNYSSFFSCSGNNSQCIYTWNTQMKQSFLSV